MRHPHNLSAHIRQLVGRRSRRRIPPSLLFWGVFFLASLWRRRRSRRHRAPSAKR